MNLDKIKPTADAKAMRERVEQSGAGDVAEALIDALTSIEKAAASGLVAIALYVKPGVSVYVGVELCRRGFTAVNGRHSDTFDRVEVSW